MNPSHHFFIFAPHKVKRSAHEQAPNMRKSGEKIREETGFAAKGLWQSFRGADPSLSVNAPWISSSLIQYLDELHRSAGHETASLVRTLCLQYSWVCVKGFATSLQHFVQAGKDRPLTPMIFRQLIRDHILPELAGALSRDSLYSVDLLDSFLRRNDVGWNRLLNAGMQYADSSDPYLVSVGQLMMLAETINQHLGWNEQEIAEIFCEFCWRFKQRNGKYCEVHSAKQMKKADQRAENSALRNWVTNGDYYRYSLSLKTDFDEHLRQRERADKRQKAKSSWNTALAEGYLHGWLAHHRRAVYTAIAHDFGESNEDIKLERLVSLLNVVPGESQAEKKRRWVLVADHAAIFAMLQRAEAWLTAAQARRRKWGGAKVVNLRTSSHAQA